MYKINTRKHKHKALTIPFLQQAQCGSIVSYGRRKRRSVKGEVDLVTLGGELTLVGGEITLRGEDEEDGELLDKEEEEEEEEEVEDQVYHEMPLQKEILVESSSVKPLKFGLLPEESGEEGDRKEVYR